MYHVFQLTEPDASFEERFSLNVNNYEGDPMQESATFFSEAVFTGGKKILQPIVDQFQIIKDTLEKEISEKGSSFNPRAFYHNTIFRDLENIIIKTFGFRDAQIETFIEGYNKKEDIFQSKVLNCYTYLPSKTRFPIEALVTDKGFYDNSHQLRSVIIFSLGLVRACSAEELTAIFIHEFGHNIDPALVCLNYIETNVMSKYLTDRIGKIDPSEKKYIGNRCKKGLAISGEIIVLIAWIAIFGIGLLIEFIKKLIFKPEQAIEKIKNAIRSDSDKFTRQINSEAFADNFARMYGLAGPLMHGLKRIGDDYDKQRESRIKKEKSRQKAIADITMYMIRDVHKTDIHRIHSLVKEFEADLKDPNIPKKVKDDIRSDLEELTKVLDAYLNHKDEFQKKINNIINDELKKLDVSTESKSPKDDSDQKEKNTTDDKDKKDDKK